METESDSSIPTLKCPPETYPNEDNDLCLINTLNIPNPKLVTCPPNYDIDTNPESGEYRCKVNLNSSAAFAPLISAECDDNNYSLSSDKTMCNLDPSIATAPSVHTCPFYYSPNSDNTSCNISPQYQTTDVIKSCTPPNSKYILNSTKSKCIGMKPPVPFTLVCPTNYSPSGDKCNINPAYKTIPTTQNLCPQNYTLNANKTSCVIKTTFAPDTVSGNKTCPTNYLLMSDKKACEFDPAIAEKDSIPITISCPDNYSLNSNKTSCVINSTYAPNNIPGNFKCKPGYTLDSSNNKKCNNSDIPLTQISNVTCPDKYQPDENNKCSIWPPILPARIPREYVCDTGNLTKDPNGVYKCV